MNKTYFHYCLPLKLDKVENCLKFFESIQTDAGDVMEALFDFLICMLLIHIIYCLIQLGVNAFLSDFGTNFGLLSIIANIKLFECRYSLFHS